MTSAISSSSIPTSAPPAPIVQQPKSAGRDSDGDNDGSKAVATAAVPQASSASVGTKINTVA
jgi:hypothetical protein